MYTPLIRLILSSFAFLYGGYKLYLDPSNIEGWLFLFAGGALVWGYFKYGTIWKAWRLYEKNDLDGLEVQLSYIKKPEWLNAQNKAYYYLLKGVVLSKNGQWETAYKNFEIATKGPLRTENVLSIVHVYLADTAIILNNLSSAKQHLQKAKKLAHNEGVDKIIEEVEQKVENVA